MLNLIKWLALLTLWARYKRSLISILLIWIFLLVFSLFISDIIEYTDKNPQDLIFLKWGVVVFFGSVSIWLIFRIIFKTGLSSSQKKKQVDCKHTTNNRLKERVLSSEKLRTKSDRIIEKYKERS